MNHEATYEWNHNCTEVEHRKTTTQRWVNCRPDSKSEHWQSLKTLMYRDDHTHKKQSHEIRNVILLHYRSDFITVFYKEAERTIADYR